MNFLPRSTTSPSTRRTRRGARSLAALSVAGLLTLSACGGSDESSEDEPAAEESSSSAPEAGEEGAAEAAPEPDLEGLPDIVAEVNGEEISRDEFVRFYETQFQSLAMQAQQTGEPIDQDKLKQETADNLIGSELLSQEADRLEITATEKQIDAEVADLLSQNGLKSLEDLAPILEQQGISEDDLLDQVANQVEVTRLVEETAPETAEVSTKEVQALYEQVSAQAGGAGGGQGQEVPPLKQVRGEIEEQIRTQKQAEAAQALVTDLREDADVTINL